MKIKLVTFAPHPNFGTCLQSYALNYVLRKMGNDVEFIYNRREVEPLSQFTYMKIFVKRIMIALITTKKAKRSKKKSLGCQKTRNGILKWLKRRVWDAKK